MRGWLAPRCSPPSIDTAAGTRRPARRPRLTRTIMHARKAASSSAHASWPPPGPFLGLTLRGRSAGVRPIARRKKKEAAGQRERKKGNETETKLFFFQYAPLTHHRPSRRSAPAYAGSVGGATGANRPPCPCPFKFE